MGKKNGGPAKAMTMVVAFRPMMDAKGKMIQREPLTIECSGTGTQDGVLRIFDVDGVILFLFPLDTILLVERTALYDRSLLSS